TFLTESSKLAHVVLPAASFGQKSGTTTNLEGRVTGVAQKVTVTGTSRPDWMIAAELALALGTELGFGTAGEITDAINENVDGYESVSIAALDENPNGI